MATYKVKLVNEGERLNTTIKVNFAHPRLLRATDKFNGDSMHA